MFTGIVQDIGEIESLEPREGDLVIGIRPSALDTTLVKLGDSIAVAGVCLTAVSIASGCLSFDVSKETLSRTLLGNRKLGDGVNLELAMGAQDRFGGHLVSGHVDGLATLIESEPQPGQPECGFPEHVRWRPLSRKKALSPWTVSA